jgi:hypothetical protein
MKTFTKLHEHSKTGSFGNPEFFFLKLQIYEN